MGIFDNIEENTDIEQDTDSIGGFAVLDSNVYGLTIDMAYVITSAGKATGLVLDFTGPSNEKLHQTFWMTSGEAKGCLNYYINKKTNKKHYLPGFNQANALALLTVGESILKLGEKVEKKTINLYDSIAKKEVPTEVDMIMPLLGQKIVAGVIKQLEDKRKKNENTGNYEPTGETRETNEIDKLFRASDQLTVVEILAKETTPVFFTKWIDRWKDKVKDKTTKTGISNGKPSAGRISGNQAPKTSLFK